MKKLFVGLFIAVLASLPSAAQTVTAPTSLPTASTLGSGDLAVGVQGGQLVIISQAQMQAWAQVGCVLTASSYTNPSWLVSLPFSKLTSTPTSLSGYGITDPVVLTTGSYANPSWITSLAASKVTGLISYVTTGGTNTYTASPSPALSSYTTGLTVLAKFTNANTGGASLNLNSLGAVPIQQNGAALNAGQIPAGSTLSLVYDGTNFQIMGNDSGGYIWSTGLMDTSGTIAIDPTVVCTLTGTQTLTNKSIDWSEITTSVPTSAIGYNIANGATLDTLAASNPFTAGTGIAFAGTWPSITINNTLAASNPFTAGAGIAFAGTWPSVTISVTGYLALHASGTPTIAAGSGAGTSPTISVSGNDVSGVITLTTGSSPSTGATVATITYHTAYGSTPNAIILTPFNSGAGSLSGATQVFVTASNTGNFVFTSGSTALTAATQYKWMYLISQQ